MNESEKVETRKSRNQDQKEQKSESEKVEITKCRKTTFSGFYFHMK